MEGMIMVIATTMANNGIRFGDIRSTFPSSCYRAVSEPYKSSRRRQARSRLFYWRCGGTYGVLHGWNVSGVVGQRYSICEKGQNEHPLTVHTSISMPRSSTPTRRRSSSYSQTWLKEQQKHGKKFTWTKRTEPMDFTPLLSPNSRKHSQQPILKVKHEPSYDTLGKAKTVLTNTLHSSES